METGGLLAAHSCGNVTIFGGSGNYGVMNASLSREIFFAYDTPSLRIAAVVRKPVPNELGEAMWFRVVNSNGGESSVSYKRTGLLLFAGNHSVEDEP